ncbi:hypothetical protein SLNWT_7117 [Streptomyces albus]|uniref:2'-5' RNA ligase family protein n=1 Tax=Streptomyces albus (strain ATCC 21838 / DSM 41398 / FERM P-419 / JCM 4703 / NBRC 107858) TaxID=1081613 RepID=A0A0B5EXE8_STRA4|nr:hypothetical protein SLNWT_7117 [Streptomyces albus]AOU81797.1 hypothetical protein SLNHY_7106 [Streptomyces albus]AYN37484.1 hypothetical protein DUI70_6991 [Streptomyces albus]
MKDFWKTHQWPTGERRAHWHILVEGQSKVAEFAAAHAELIARFPQLTPVPVPWLHMTLLSIGSIDVPQMKEVAHAVSLGLRAASLDPFEIEVGPAQATREGITVAVYPEEELSSLFWTVRQATEEVLGKEVLPPAPARFWPHLSLAYSNADWDHDELSRALTRLRPAQAPMTVSQVHLVDQQQDWRIQDTPPEQP